MDPFQLDFAGADCAAVAMFEGDDKLSAMGSNLGSSQKSDRNGDVQRRT